MTYYEENYENEEERMREEKEALERIRQKAEEKRVMEVEKELREREEHRGRLRAGKEQDEKKKDVSDNYRNRQEGGD